MVETFKAETVNVRHLQIYKMLFYDYAKKYNLLEEYREHLTSGLKIVYDFCLVNSSKNSRSD